MVMEAAHSAQSVGREFVRQYYTLLNKAPAHLHRFYSHDSSFIHGGLSTSDRDITPAIGQKEIHQMIQQLNFRDCHTRISQVDSQATLGDGVVVQVTGEFSNGGEPMRRFTQTFVLAAQGAKTYYVHNDIFRYQDLGFPDDEEDELEGETGLGETAEREVEEGRSEAEEDEQAHQTQVQEPQGHPGIMPAQPTTLQQPQQQMYYSVSSQQVHPMQPVINGSVHEETALLNQPQQPQQQQQQLLPQQTVPPQQYIEPAAPEQFTQEPEPIAEQPQQPPQTAEEETRGQHEDSQEQPATETFQPTTNEPETEHNATANTNSNKPKSYARTVRSSAMGSSSNQVPKTSVSPPPVTNVRNEDRGMDMWVTKNTTVSNNSMSSGPQHRMGSNQMSDQQQTPQQRPVRNVGPPQKDNRGGRRDWPDHHQLFVGNVPHQATSTELRVIFEKFGKVADLRIYSKDNIRGKGPQGQNNSGRVPYYGFVTFEEAHVVAKVLSAGPIGYPDESGQKLNIEEKKNKPRAPGDGNMRSNANDGGMRSSMGGQQQQNQQQRGPGGPGILRGSQHSRGGRGFSRDGGRGGMRQPGNMGNPGYQNRR